VVDPRWTLRVGLLQFEERGLADLQVDRGGISLRVAVPEGFLETELLRVERRRVRNARDREADVVQHDASGPGAIVLRHGRLYC
jgi:hypothetical protein